MFTAYGRDVCSVLCTTPPLCIHQPTSNWGKREAKAMSRWCWSRTTDTATRLHEGRQLLGETMNPCVLCRIISSLKAIWQNARWAALVGASHGLEPHSTMWLVSDSHSWHPQPDVCKQLLIAGFSPRSIVQRRSKVSIHVSTVSCAPGSGWTIQNQTSCSVLISVWRALVSSWMTTKMQFSFQFPLFRPMLTVSQV